jgi:hypothetical protein
VFTDQQLEDLRVAREEACARARVLLADLPHEGDPVDPNVVYLRRRSGHLIPFSD